MTTSSEPTQQQLWARWGARVKAARGEMSQEELADRAKVSQATISAIENGVYGGRVVTQLAIEKALDRKGLFSPHLDDDEQFPDEQVAS